MAISYDLKEDTLYLQAKKDMIEEMLKDPSSRIEKIAQFTQTSVAFVKRVKKEVDKK